MPKNKWNVDSEYIVAIRRELHMYPELNYENPLTLGIIRRELDKLELPYTENFGRGGVVATLNEGKGAYTIGIRADMDAIPMQEVNDIPYKSTIDGNMHACGHDIHTAILLGTAKALSEMKDEIACCVKFIFQTAEEGPDTGARYMVADGVMDDIDVIVAQHVDNSIEIGQVGLTAGPALALCHPFKIILEGEATHITTPQKGKDALAMAVRVHQAITTMVATEVDPFEPFICGIGTCKSGTSFGSVSGYTEMDGVITTYDMDLDAFLTKRVETIVKNVAEEVGGTGRLEHEITCLVTKNDPDLCERVTSSAEKVLGAGNCLTLKQILGCEDFSFFQSKKPGVLFWLGSGNKAKGFTSYLHNNDFMPDEDSFELGSSIFVQFVQDNMNSSGERQ